MNTKNDIFYGFRKTFEYRLRLTITHAHFLIIVALGFHALMVQFNIDNLKSWRKVVVNGQEYIELDSGQLIEIQEQKIPRDPTKISMRLNSNSRSRKQPAKLESLLERELKKAMKQKKVKVAKRGSKIKGQSAKKKEFGLFNVPDYMQKEVELETTKKASLDLGKVRKIVYQKNSQYQKCYEKSLLNDEFMEGLVKIEILVNQRRVKKSLVDFNGSGNKKAVEQLQDCLKSQLAGLKFMPEIQNEVVRFNLFFKS
jgi:hypothetical protein